MYTMYKVRGGDWDEFFLTEMDRQQLVDVMDNDIYATIINNDTGEIIYDRRLEIYDGEMY